MKLDDQLHLLEAKELARLMYAYGGFIDAGAVSASMVADGILNRELREAEWSTDHSSTSCIFWSSGRLKIIKREHGIGVFEPGVIALSVYRGSVFAATATALGLVHSIHPFAYTPEWIDCFVIGPGVWR